MAKELKWIRIDKGTLKREVITLKEVKKGLKDNYKDIEQAVYSLVTKQVSSLNTPFFIYEVQ